MRLSRSGWMCLVGCCSLLLCSCGNKKENEAWEKRMREVLPLVEECKSQGFLGTLEWEAAEEGAPPYWGVTYVASQDNHGDPQYRTDPLPFQLKGKVLIWECATGEPDWDAMEFSMREFWAEPDDEDVSFIVITDHFREPRTIMGDVARVQHFDIETGKEIGKPHSEGFVHDRACIVLWPERKAYGLFAVEGSAVNADLSSTDRQVLQAADSRWRHFVKDTLKAGPGEG